MNSPLDGGWRSLMAILVGDANIFIDVTVSNLSEAMFRLEDTIATPDVLYQDELLQHHPELPGLGLQINCAGSGHVGLAGFSCPLLAKVFHRGHQVQRAVGPDMVVEALVFGQCGRGVLGGLSPRQRFQNSVVELSLARSTMPLISGHLGGRTASGRPSAWQAHFRPVSRSRNPLLLRQSRPATAALDLTCSPKERTKRGPS